MLFLYRMARIGIRVGERSTQVGVRESMQYIGDSLPGALYRTIQRFLTWLTGKTLEYQHPLFELNPWMHVALNTLVLACGVLLGSAAVTLRGAAWALLPLAWLLTVHAARKFFLVICHAGIHDVFSKRAWVNRLFVDITSLFMLTAPYEQFRQEHAVDHHARHFSGKGDPDADVLYSVGLRPGRSLEALWIAVAIALVNPLFHARYTLARVNANFIAPKLWRCVLAWIFYAGVGLLVYRFHAATLFFVAWLIPVTVGFQMAALVTFAGEHKWFHSQGEDQARGIWMQEQTAARFMGEIYPQHMATTSIAVHFLRVSAWWLRLITWFLPLRLLVVPGDMPVHDYHHSNPRGDWTNTLYARSRWIAEKQPHASETWGLCAAVNHALRPMSEYLVDYLAQPDKTGDQEMFV